MPLCNGAYHFAQYIHIPFLRSAFERTVSETIASIIAKYFYTITYVNMVVFLQKINLDMVELKLKSFKFKNIV